MKDKNIVILGAGGFGREASLLVEEINNNKKQDDKWNLLGFIDEDKGKWEMVLRGYPVLGGLEVLDNLPESVSLICAVGDPVDKKKMVSQALELERRFASLVHPNVVLAEDVVLGEGVLVNKGCILTTDIIIGSHVSINPGCGIGHDASIGDYATLMWHVNISGAVEIGEGCLMGSKATVLQGKKVGAWSVVGAGAVVIDDLPGGCTAVGVPARVISEQLDSR